MKILLWKSFQRIRNIGLERLREWISLINFARHSHRRSNCERPVWFAFKYSSSPRFPEKWQWNSLGMQCLSLVRAFGWHYRLDSHEYARARCFTCPNTRRRCSSSYLESFREQNASVTAVHFACTCILARSRLFSLLFLSLWLARRIRNKIIPLRARVPGSSLNKHFEFKFSSSQFVFSTRS